MSRRSYRCKPTKVSKILRHMRKEKGFSLRQAARRIGISNCMISHIEVGREDVPKARLESMVAAYGFTMLDFNAYLEGRRMPLDYRAECIELVKRLDQDKLKAVHTVLTTFGA